MTKDHFLNRIKPGQISTNLLDMLPDTIMCIKNLESIYVHVNNAFAATLQKPIENIVDHTDEQLFGAELAKVYVKDDKLVMSSGKQMLSKSELVTYRPGVVRWYVTSKIPIYDNDDIIVGVAALSYPSKIPGGEGLAGPMQSVSKAVEYVYENVDTPVSVDELAAVCGLSISSLERYFKKHFDTSPGRFITQVRMSRACELLAEPSYSINHIADLMGFSDAVVFSRSFKREMRVSPRVYRIQLKNLV